MERRNFFFALVIVSSIQDIYPTDKIFTCGESIRKKKLLLYLKKTLSHECEQYHDLGSYCTYLSGNLTITRLWKIPWNINHSLSGFLGGDRGEFEEILDNVINKTSSLSNISLVLNKYNISKNTNLFSQGKLSK